MWLINTTTMCLEQVFYPEDEKYAILSHTWGAEEVSFQEFADPERRKQKRGFAKIEKTCELAKSRGLHYAWVDTCCIDKSSSAELSEAINSMFNWYRWSSVCFAYIEDLVLPGSDVDFSWLSKDVTYRWFTRGWTLQELIAPQEVEFYTRSWRHCGNKSSLVDSLSRVTGIDKTILLDNKRLSALPVARRMSWASRRQTTRVEDMAYCLLGIFSVNMPMLYGEGDRAFIRLQEEIAKETDDLSMFAWIESRGPSTANTFEPAEYLSGPGSVLENFHEFSGILASSPRGFANCGDIMRFRNPLDPAFDTFSMTNNGVKLKAELGETEDLKCIMNLSCVRRTTAKNPGELEWIGIFLTKATFGKYVRLQPDKLFYTSDRANYSTEKNTIYLHKFLRPEAKDQILQERRGRMYIDFTFHVPRGVSRQKDGWYSVSSPVAAPETQWVPESGGGYFLTMEPEHHDACAPDLYETFAGLLKFNLKYHGLHVCTCVLVCGYFNGLPSPSSELGPSAILFSDQDEDEHTKAIFNAV
ncbi:heterokaryon incompatibility protein-domain-containing protein, partial [Cladorrhinum sp. PSN259]